MPWKWENSEKTLILPVDFCRDQFIFDTDTPRQNTAALTPDQNQVSWTRKGDTNERCFYVPVDLINNFPVNSNLFRDTIACVTQLYIDQSCPSSNIIASSIRQIADNMGIACNGDRAREIEESLVFARFYTVAHQPLYKIEKGKTIKYDSTFGFVNSVSKEVAIDGVPVSPKSAKTIIEINNIYAQIIKDKKLPKAPVPVAALRKANQGPRRLITPTKNLVYSLSALAPKIEIEYSLEKIKQITGFREERHDRLRKSIENVLTQLFPVMLSNYTFDTKNQKYMITLAAKKCDPIRQEV